MFHSWVSNRWYLQRFSRGHPGVYLIYQCCFLKTNPLLEYAAVLLILSIQRGCST